MLSPFDRPLQTKPTPTLLTTSIKSLTPHGVGLWCVGTINDIVRGMGLALGNLDNGPVISHVKADTD